VRRPKRRSRASAHAGTDGLALWKALGLPSFVVLDRADLRLERIEATIA